jgi:hypothetical protein
MHTRLRPRSVRDLSPIRAFCATAILAFVFPAHSHGQERDVRGGHGETDEAGRRARVVTTRPGTVRTYTGGARVVTWRHVPFRPTERVPDRMGFRPEAADDAPPEAKVETALNVEPDAESTSPAEPTSPPESASPEPGSTSSESALPAASAEEYRRGRDAFDRGDYVEAAARFRSAVDLAPEHATPLLALGRTYVAMGQDGPAARTLRRAIRRDPEVLRRPHDAAGEYGERAEYDRVMKALGGRASATPSNADSKFVLAIERFFAGDARCRETFAWLLSAVPEDEVAALCLAAATKRFGPREPGKDPARGAREETKERRGEPR